MLHLLVPALVSLPVMPPAVTLPGEVRASPGRLIRLTAETHCRHVCWTTPSDDADLVPFPDGKFAVFCSPKPGRYLVLAWTAQSDLPSAAARCIVVVGDASPEPAPTPPMPVNPFAEDLRTLFQADTSADKAQHLAQLAAVYHEAVRFTRTADVKTLRELASRIRTAVASLLPDESLVAVRRRIAEEVGIQLPTDPNQPLTTEIRARAASLFERIASTLEDLR